MNDPRLSMGGNAPPEPTPIERAETLVITANRWITERPTIETDEIAAFARDFVDQLRKCSKALQEGKNEEKLPHVRATNEIDGRYRAPVAKVALALDDMRVKLTAWGEELERRNMADKQRLLEVAQQAQTEAEQASLEAEIAVSRGNAIDARLTAQLAAERAEAALALAEKPAGPVQIRGEYADRAMSMRTTWHAEIIDPEAALKTYGKHHDVRNAALEAALRVATAAARAAKDEAAAPKGFRFFSTQKAT